MDMVETFFILSFSGFFMSFFYVIYALLRYASKEDAKLKGKEKYVQKEERKEMIENKSLTFIVWISGFFFYFLSLMSAANYSADKESTIAITYLAFVSLLLFVHFFMGIIYFLYGFSKTIRKELE